MNILWQNEHYPDVVRGGGGAVNTYYITRAFGSLGHHAVILARQPRTANGSLPSSALDGRLGRDGAPVIHIPVPEPPRGLWRVWPLLEPRSLQPLLRRIAPAFDAFVCVDPAYALALRRLRPDARLVYRVEGTNKGHNRAVRAPASPGGSVCSVGRRSVERLLAAEADLMDRLTWRRCDAIVVKSAFMRSELVSLYRVPGDKVHVVPNGVDYDRYALAAATREARERVGNAAEDRVVITYCGRLVAMKNVSFLLQAFARMRTKGRCVLAIVGDGDERQRLETEADRLGIAAHTTFVGHTARVEDYLAVSHIFVLPSTYEPFGNALLEAMAAGLPCVALRPDFRRVRTASGEIIAEGTTGYLVDPSDPGDMARTLDLLVADPQARRVIGTTARGVCERHYSWNRCAGRYLELLDLGTARTAVTGVS